jgi:hypothetical protein
MMGKNSTGEEFSLVLYNAMYSVKNQPTFRMNMPRQPSKYIPIMQTSWLSFVAGFCFQVGSKMFFINAN